MCPRFLFIGYPLNSHFWAKNTYFGLFLGYFWAKSIFWISINSFFGQMATFFLRFSEKILKFHKSEILQKN